MSKKTIYTTLIVSAIIIPVGFTFASTKAQTSTTIERQEFDLAISSQKEVDIDQNKRISKLESSESSTVDFTDLGKEVTDSLPKLSTPSVNDNSKKTIKKINNPTVYHP